MGGCISTLVKLPTRHARQMDGHPYRIEDERGAPGVKAIVALRCLRGNPRQISHMRLKRLVYEIAQTVP